MNLKTLISIKFISILLFLGTLAFLYYQIDKYNSSSERQNNISDQQFKFWNLKKEMSPNDTTGLATLESLIDENESLLKKEQEVSNAIPYSFYSICFIACLIIGRSTISYLDEEIEKIKKSTNDKGEML